MTTVRPTDSVGLSALVSALPAISLVDVDESVALQERVDRKYVVTAHQLVEMIEHLCPRLAALEIDGRRCFDYESTYFDTVDLRTFHDAARRRRRRFKVRTRTYLDTRGTMLEVKIRARRGVTLKLRRPHEFGARASLDPASWEFIESVVDAPGLASTMQPVLTTTYRRITLVDLDGVARVTIDADLRCVDWTGRSVALLDSYIVESKSKGSPSVIDRYMWRTGIRPTTISKFGTGLAALHPELPSNRWHRTLQRHFW